MHFISILYALEKTILERYSELSIIVVTGIQWNSIKENEKVLEMLMFKN